MVAAAGLIAGLAFAPGALHAQIQDGVEQELQAALSYSPARGERLKDPGVAIRAYIKAGYVSRKPHRGLNGTRRRHSQ